MKRISTLLGVVILLGLRGSAGVVTAQADQAPVVSRPK